MGALHGPEWRQPLKVRFGVARIVIVSEDLCPPALIVPQTEPREIADAPFQHLHHAVQIRGAGCKQPYVACPCCALQGGPPHHEAEAVAASFLACLMCAIFYHPTKNKGLNLPMSCLGHDGHRLANHDYCNRNHKTDHASHSQLRLYGVQRIAGPCLTTECWVPATVSRPFVRGKPPHAFAPKCQNVAAASHLQAPAPMQPSPILWRTMTAAPIPPIKAWWQIRTILPCSEVRRVRPATSPMRCGQ